MASSAPQEPVGLADGVAGAELLLLVHDFEAAAGNDGGDGIGLVTDDHAAAGGLYRTREVKDVGELSAEACRWNEPAASAAL